ncbi:hypothetical protein ES703_43758 [subsurface metagenome]
MFSTTPPRPRVLLIRTARSVPTHTMLLTVTLRTPPDISLPMTMAPWPLYITQLVMVTFSVGLPFNLPSSSRPDFNVMQSSPVSKKQFEMRTLRQDSGFTPSVFGADSGLIIEIPSTTRFSQPTRWTVHDGESAMVIPWIRTLRQR